MLTDPSAHRPIGLELHQAGANALQEAEVGWLGPPGGGDAVARPGNGESIRVISAARALALGMPPKSAVRHIVISSSATQEHFSSLFSPKKSGGTVLAGAPFRPRAAALVRGPGF